MTKVEAVKYMLKNMSTEDKQLLFKESLDIKTLRQFIVGLDWEHLGIMKTVLGGQFFNLLLEDVESNKKLITEIGFSVSVSVVLAEFESLQDSGAITFSFPEESETTEEQSLSRVEDWLKTVRAEQ